MASAGDHGTGGRPAGRRRPSSAVYRRRRLAVAVMALLVLTALAVGAVALAAILGRGTDATAGSPILGDGTSGARVIGRMRPHEGGGHGRGRQEDVRAG